MTRDYIQPEKDQYAELLAALGDLDRAATASIRGYFTQLIYTALEWLNLSDDEVLLVEGREDLDRILLDPQGHVREVNEIQLKDLAKIINARSEEVWESIFNFLLSHKFHQDNGCKVRMLFATTASLKHQTVAASTELRKTPKTRRLDLEVDVISTWKSLPGMEEEIRLEAIGKLTRAIHGLFDMNLRPRLANPASDEELQHVQAIQTALEYHDQNSKWSAFLNSVSWLTELGSATELRGRLETRIAAESSRFNLPAPEFSRVLIYRVLETASKADVVDRILTTKFLQEIANETSDSLHAWAQEIGLAHLQQWQLFFTESLAEHEERIEKLEEQISVGLPTLDRAWSSIRNFTNSTRRRVRVEVAGVHVDREEQLESLEKNLKSARVVVLLGPSGVGKSALARKHTENLDSHGGLTLWLSGTSLERPDLAALQSDLNFGLTFETVFNDYSGIRTLVLDGIDQVYGTSAMALVADLLKALQVGSSEPFCELVITCQTSGWSGLEGRLRQEGIIVSGWTFQQCQPPRLEELKAVWAAAPAARGVLRDQRLASLMRNLKILDLVVSRISAGVELELGRLVGESSVASWFWDHKVVCGPQKRARDVFATRLGELQADQLRLSVPLVDFQILDATAVDDLEKDQICVVDERNHVLFVHDLYADWARLRAIQSHKENLVEYLRPRLESPLWHRAVRLFGSALLDEGSDVEGWKELLQNLQDIGGETTADLLLESVVFAANAENHLLLLTNELLSGESNFLDRLLGRFLAFGTLPDPEQRDIGRSVGMTDTEISSLFRYPNWPYWPAVLQFLHKHRDHVTKICPERIAKIVTLWLKYSPPETILRREAGELGLSLGHLALAEDRSSFEDHRSELFASALAGVPECKKEVVEFALKASERTTERKPVTPSSSVAHRLYSGCDSDMPPPPPAPDGPVNRVDEDFRAAVLEDHALQPLIHENPVAAREVILACLLAPKPQYYGFSLEDCDADLAHPVRGWSPPHPFRGPFLAFLRINYSEGLEVIARLVDFAASQWVERRQQEKMPGDFPYDVNSPGLLEVNFTGFSRTLSGDGRIFGWSAGLGSPLSNSVITSALMALEYYLYEAMETKADIEAMVHVALERARSVPILGVLLDVGRKEPKLFAGPLMPLLGISELYSWEMQIRVQGRFHLGIGAFLEGKLLMTMLHEFNSQPHRNLDLRHIAVELFISNEEISQFLVDRASNWESKVDELQSDRERDMLLQLVAMFNKDNYEQIDLGDGRTGVVNIALKEREEAMREERVAHDEKLLLLTLPSRCRSMLDEEECIAEEDLQTFLADLKRVEAVWKKSTTTVEASEEVDKPAPYQLGPAGPLDMSINAFAGGVAVLLCLHHDWVSKQSELLDWCRNSLREIVENPPPEYRMGSPETVSSWLWDCFAAEAAVALWERSPQDPDSRRLVAELIFSYHNLAVGRLMRRVSLMRPVRFEDTQGLRRLVFEHAYIRIWLKFFPHNGERIEEDRVEESSNAPNLGLGERVKSLAGRFRSHFNFFRSHRNQPEKDSIQQGLKAVYARIQGHIEDFVVGCPKIPTDEWEQMDFVDLFPQHDPLRRADFGGYLLDFKLVRIAHEAACDVEVATSKEERAYRLWFLKRALTFSLNVIKKDRHELMSRYPSDDARWVLEQLAAAVSTMSPEEYPENILVQIVNIPKGSHHWSQVFLNSFFTHNLCAESPPESFPQLANEFISLILALPPDQQWDLYEDAWPALFGIHDYTHRLWQERHAGIAEYFWPLIARWISQDRFGTNHLDSIARWLATDAAANLRLKALSALQSVVNTRCKDRRYDHKHLENAVADLLELIWKHHENTLQQQDNSRAAFQLLLRWLGDRQHRVGLELLGRIGNLSG